MNAETPIHTKQAADLATLRRRYVALRSYVIAANPRLVAEGLDAASFDAWVDELCGEAGIATPGSGSYAH